MISDWVRDSKTYKIDKSKDKNQREGLTEKAEKEQTQNKTRL